MNCREIMSRNLEWLSDTATAKQAAAKMAESGVGFLPVCDSEGRPLGVVTDRDLTTRVLAKSIPADTTSVREVMSSPVITCLADTDVEVAQDLMAKEQKQRLPCIDVQGRVVGIISLADLIEHASASAAIETARAVLWRDALGPRGGAARGAPLLKDDPSVLVEPPGDEHPAPHESVTISGRRHGSMKEFPG